MYKKIKLFVIVFLVLGCYFTCNGSAATLCNQQHRSLPSSYTYTYTDNCSSTLSSLEGSLKSTNRAKTKFSTIVTKIEISSYVEERNSNGTIKSNSHTGQLGVSSCVVDPIFFTPVRVYHRGSGEIGGACNGIHIILVD